MKDFFLLLTINIHKMKRYLGLVTKNNDKEYQKRVQAHIIGLTDDGDVPPKNLPYAFPLDSECIIPAINDKVWIYVDKEQESEDYDYNRLWYRRFTEKTYLEAYDYDKSDSYSTKSKSLIPTEEPPLPTSVKYPKNRVIKISDITVEFDEGNARFCLTDKNGNYYQMDADNVTVKSVKKMNVLAKDEINIYSAKKTRLKALNKLEIKTAAMNLKSIVDDIQAILFNVTTTGNWTGNLGLPVIYSMVGTDLPKATLLQTKINSLLE